MRASFHFHPLGKPFGDPCVHVRMADECRSLLFDLGTLSGLGHSDLFKISDVFVTHMHIDHFIGFDTLLRAVLRKEEPLRIYGPEGITACVGGKLQGYTWNLIGDYPIRIEVHEISGSTRMKSVFRSMTRFVRESDKPEDFENMVLGEPLFSVHAVELSHDIPVLAYRIDEKEHLNIDKAVLREMDLPVGPWLSELKSAVRNGLSPDSPIMIGETVRHLRDLLPLVMRTQGISAGYLMDISPEEENIERASAFFRGCDLLFTEAYFLECDRDRAEHRNHLTAADAGRIARESGVKRFEILHISPKYFGCPDAVLDEAMRAFRGEKVSPVIVSVPENPVKTE